MAVFLVIFTAVIHTAFADPPSEQLEQILEDLKTEYDIPAVAAAVVNSDGLVASAAVGVRQQYMIPLPSSPVSLDDQWHIGSCTKAFTASLYGRHVDQGILPSFNTTLDNAFDGIIPVHPDYANVTVSMLLSHRAGLPRDPTVKDLAYMTLHNMTLTESRQYLAEQYLTKAPSGTVGQYVYSNLGFILAGALIEQTTGVPFEDDFIDEICEPLGMTSCGWGPPTGKNPWGHLSTPSGLIPINPILPPPLSDNPPVYNSAGRLHLTIADWCKFLSAHLRGHNGDESFLSSETLNILHSVGSPPDYYSHAMVQSNQPWGIYGWHNGSNTKWYVTHHWFLGLDTGIIIATNRYDEEAVHAMSDGSERIIAAFLQM